MRAMRRVFVIAVLSGLAVAALPSAGAQTPTVTSVIGSADGLTVALEIDPPVGDPQTLGFGPAPSVTLPPEGGFVSDEMLDVDEAVLGVGLTATTLGTSAEGELGPAGFATAESVVEDLALAIVGATSIAEAEVISATCDADLSGVSGSSILVGASVLGDDISGEPAPNTTFEIAVTNGITAIIGVTLNRQVENPDGSLSVTALALDIDISSGIGEITGTLEIGPATCGVVEGVVPPAPPAPVPAPVTVTPRFTG